MTIKNPDFLGEKVDGNKDFLIHKRLKTPEGWTNYNFDVDMITGKVDYNEDMKEKWKH